MLDSIKRLARRRFPAALAAYHSYRLNRDLEARSLRQTPHGFRFRGHDAMETGSFEPLESALIADFARPGSVYVDVGANFGYFVCMARRAGSHVVAVEPLAQNLDVLYSNLEANGFADVEIFPLGLGAAPGTAVLYGGGTAASLVPRWAGTSEVFKRTIAISTLDVVLGDRFPGAPMLIKIDVEGMEHTVLEGASRTLARTPAPEWLVEICLTENQPQGCNPFYADVFEAFWRHGYTARSVEADLRDVTAEDVKRWVEQGQRDFGYVSFLFQRTS